MFASYSDDIYNVDLYSDAELYQLLGVEENVEDALLEEKILRNVYRYDVIGNEESKRMSQFYIDVYHRFFDIDGETKPTHPVKEGLIDATSEGAQVSDADLDIANAQASQFTATQAQLDVSNEPSAGPDGKVDKLTKDATGNITVTKSVPYSRDKLNPLLQQTVKRIVSIDSQYRENKKMPSTAFTFNLSEPLRDVVSIKLYSVQIPYTWYTVNNSFGGNFLTFRGAVDGINDGAHDYLVQITSGNYSPAGLVSAINTSIQDLSGKYTDVYFGNTGISYNEQNTRATMIVDIRKLYDQSNYYVEFPVSTLVTDPVQRANNLAIYLGYSYNTYSCGAVCSERDLPLTDTSITSIDNTSNTYLVNEVNSNFKIVQYTGATYATKTAEYFVLDLSLSYGVRSRNSIFQEVNALLHTNVYLDTAYSFMERVDISNVYYANDQKSFYRMNMKWNRNTVHMVADTKMVVVFPDETALDPNYNPVWTGSNSCFHYMFRENDVNEVLAETPMVQSTYYVDGLQQVQLVCNSAPYDTSYNTYFITVPEQTLGYTFSEYIHTLNNAIAAANLTESISENANDLNTPNTQFAVDNMNHVDISVDINRVFKNKYYTLYVNHRMLGAAFTVDLSNVSTSTFTNQYRSFSFTLTPSDEIILVPKSEDGFVTDVNAGTFRIAVSQPTTYNSFIALQQGMNSLFVDYVDALGDRPLSGSSVSINFVSGANPYFEVTLRIQVRKTLTQLNYDLLFYDSTVVEPTDPNQWTEQLFFDSFYRLSNYEPVNGVTTITNNSPISDNQIVIKTGVNDRFSIKPYSNISGLYSRLETYVVNVVIPPGTYSRNTLYTAINTVFASNPLSQNSHIGPYTENGIEYTMISVMINQTYTTKDYSVVYYDPTNSITNCGALKNITAAAKVATWDTTIGWLLGFHETPIYLMSEYLGADETTGGLYYYKSTSPNECVMVGDTSVSVNLFNYLMIVLDDYTMNHLNDGLVTTGMQETNMELDSGVNKVCDPIASEPAISTANVTGSGKMTQNAMYAQTQKLLSQKVKAKSYSTGPYVKDVFGIVPLKLTGLANGAVYVEFGGTLQNQERVYFGPVNIHRMTIKLMNDRGDLVDLNNANWSFSFVAEQLYKS